MSNETEAGNQTLDSSSDTIFLRLRQEREMDSQENQPVAAHLRSLRSTHAEQEDNPRFRMILKLSGLIKQTFIHFYN